MTVWVAEAGHDYGDTFTLGVFSSDEKARDHIQKLKDAGRFFYDWDGVTRHVLDNPDD